MRTKLNIFRLVLIAFIIAYVLALLVYVLITFTSKHTIPGELIRVSIFGSSIAITFYSYFIMTIIVDILLVYSLIQLLKISDYLKNDLFFTPTIIKRLKTTGNYFVVIAIVGFFASIFYHYSFSENFSERMLLPLFYHFMVLIIGLGVLVIEEIQKRALMLKTENDLTI